MDFIPDWLSALEDEDLVFVKKFLLASGSLKEMARQYGVTYPTVRLRLDRLIQKISLADRREEEPFLTYIRSLVPGQAAGGERQAGLRHRQATHPSV